MKPGYELSVKAEVPLHPPQHFQHAPILVARNTQPLIHGLQLQSQVLQASHLPGRSFQQL